MKSMRAPSYKAIAIAVLRNDHLLRSVGFSEKDGDLRKVFREEKETDQMDLFK